MVHHAYASGAAAGQGVGAAAGAAHDIAEAMASFDIESLQDPDTLRALLVAERARCQALEEAAQEAEAREGEATARLGDAEAELQAVRGELEVRSAMLTAAEEARREAEIRAAADATESERIYSKLAARLMAAEESARRGDAARGSPGTPGTPGAAMTPGGATSSPFVSPERFRMQSYDTPETDAALENGSAAKEGAAGGSAAKGEDEAAATLRRARSNLRSSEARIRLLESELATRRTEREDAVRRASEAAAKEAKATNAARTAETRRASVEREKATLAEERLLLKRKVEQLTAAVAAKEAELTKCSAERIANEQKAQRWREVLLGGESSVTIA